MDENVNSYELSQPTISDERKVLAGKKKEVSNLKAWGIVALGVCGVWGWLHGGSDYLYDYVFSKWLNIIDKKIGG